MDVRPTYARDAPAIWRIIGPIIHSGERYAQDR